MASGPGGIIESTNTIPGAFLLHRNAGAPVAGTNEVWTLTIGGTPTSQAGSGVSFSYQGLVTGLALWSATNATFVANIQAVLDTFFGTGATVVAVGTATAGVGTFTITFSGAQLAKKNLTAVAAVNNLLAGTSPTAAMARTTPGVDATFRNALPGVMLTDTTNGVLYHNSATTAGAPTWTKPSAE